MASSLLVSSPISPRSYAPANSKLSFTHFNKHLAGTLSRNAIQTPKTSRNAQTRLSLPILSIKTKPHLLKCFNSRTSRSYPPGNSLSAITSRLTPAGFVKWSLIFVAGVLAARWVVNLLFNPFFWVYFSETWVVLPRIVINGIGVYGIYALYKHLKGGANEIEQAGSILFVLTYLTIVPQVLIYGVLGVWPTIYFCVYLLYFIVSNAFIRRIFDGNLFPVSEDDSKWERVVPKWYTGLFCGVLVVAHWLAVLEVPPQRVTTGGWLSIGGIWLLILTSFVVNFFAMWQLGRHTKKLVVPLGVMKVGLYRWFRHPMYASTMLLLASYFIAFKAPISLLLVVAASFAYYEQKTKLEEAMLLETYGEVYKAYMDKVRHKYIPFIY